MRRKSSNRTSGLWPTPRVHENGQNLHFPERGYALSTAVRVYFPTSEPSTEPPTEAQPYLPAGFLASHFPRPGSAEARKMTVTSGRKCSELYRKSGPLGCLVRTLLESSRWNSTECFLTWKVKATPSNRLLFQLAPSMPNTEETEFGLWQSPMPSDVMGGRTTKGKDRQNETGIRKQALWATPRME